MSFGSYTMNQVWRAEEEDFVLANASHIKDGDLAAALSERFNRTVTLHALRAKRRRLCLKKKSGRGVCELEIFRVRHLPALQLTIGGTSPITVPEGQEAGTQG